MLVSPTEPAALRQLGRTSSTPERFGVDFLFSHPTHLLVGVQRKEIKDLVASVMDGRLVEELGRMSRLGIGVLLVEGRVQWTTDGLLMGAGSSEWTVANHLGLLWSAQLRGYWVASVSTMTETIDWLSVFSRWLAKDRTSTLSYRQKIKTHWGRRDDRDWGIHMLQSFPLIGPELAGAMFDAFGGVPLRWDVGEEDMMAVDGIGKVRARKLIDALRHSNGSVAESA